MLVWEGVVAFICFVVYHGVIKWAETDVKTLSDGAFKDDQILEAATNDYFDEVINPLKCQKMSLSSLVDFVIEWK